ncbi:hypothetical protein Nepgr_016432 [Nepenthes gracilis]|uniref:Uncharacterized protein n=1 Tax=Nepenthes gracilis TaxID=150966 RepID=A0AAD3SQB3_NEPGR|nr:hypothetical protein Nepgr_016432 [Nepenthes gracilis]
MVREGIWPRNLASTAETGVKIAGAVSTSNTFAALQSLEESILPECMDEALDNEVSSHTSISSTAPVATVPVT